MDALRTPDERFDDLPGWPYPPQYAEVPDGDGGALRVHHIDEGPSAGEVVLLVHGEPTWGYLYRKMVPVLVDAGLRVVVPDLVGFGRSDKPVDRTHYTYDRHIAWLTAHIDAIGLDQITLFGQDWGGLLGLRIVAQQPERFSRVVVGNTFLPDGSGANEAFRAWRRFSQEVDELPIGRIVDSGCLTDLAPEVVAAYDAPFPDQRYVAGARQFPALVPTDPGIPGAAENTAAWEALGRYERPFLTAFSDSDPIMAGGDRRFQEVVPGAAGQPHVTIQGASHFLQEDQGEQLAQVIVDFVAAT